MARRRLVLVGLGQLVGRRRHCSRLGRGLRRLGGDRLGRDRQGLERLDGHLGDSHRHGRLGGRLRRSPRGDHVVGRQPQWLGRRALPRRSRGQDAREEELHLAERRGRLRPGRLVGRLSGRSVDGGEIAGLRVGRWRVALPHPETRREESPGEQGGGERQRHHLPGFEANLDLVLHAVQVTHRSSLVPGRAPTLTYSLQAV